MKNFFKKFLHKVISYILKPLKYIISKEDIIILQTYDQNIYCENTKYLYEYLSNNSDLLAYWVTRSNKVSDYLFEKKFKFINPKKNIFKFIYITLKAKIIIDTGTRYYNPFDLISKKVTKITTYHGNGPKVVLTPGLEELEIRDINQFDFVNFPSNFSLNITGKTNYKIPSKKLINLGYPRCDQFFDKEIVDAKFKEKKVTKYLLNGQYETNNKIILYTPTWRPYKYNFPLFELKNFDLNYFNSFLEKKGIYFFYSFHMVNHPTQVPKNLSRIIYIDRKKFPFYDTCDFMCEVNLLINDYSTTTTDFSLLKRPQLFFLPDFEKYNKAIGFVENYRKIFPGKEFKTYEEMIEQIEKYIIDPTQYNQEFNIKINQFLQKYYDEDNGDSCLNFKNFIKQNI